MPSIFTPADISRIASEDAARALEEDVGAGDLTAALVPAATSARATLLCREAAVLCGVPWFEAVLRRLDARIVLRWLVPEGAPVHPNQTLCELEGNARALLTAERTALNYLQTLSGVATVTRRYVDAVAGTPAQIYDTRKTIPGLRRAQKYAVAVGGGVNHRMGLYDAILIKENHIAAAGGIPQALAAARALGAGVTIQIEVENLNQLETALQAGADLVLLDNFDLATLKAAVKITAARAKLEASGNISLDNVREVAGTGVDRISVGALTKHLRAVDLSLRFR